MAKLELKVNNRLEVIKGKWRYKSIVQDIKDNCLQISVPVIKGRYLTLQNKEEIKIIYYDNNSNLFNFNCKVIERGKDGNIIYYKLSLPYDIKKIQRRDFVRVKIFEFIEYKKVGEILVEDKEYENTSYRAILLDLSGGGMKIKSKENLNIGELLLIDINYDDTAVKVKGNVVRGKKEEDSYFYGISFLNIDSKTREKIIKVVFSIMRKQRELI